MTGFSDMRQSRQLRHQDSTTVSARGQSVPVDVAPAGRSEGHRAVVRAVPGEGDSLQRQVAGDVDRTGEAARAEHAPEQAVLACREPQVKATVLTLADGADVPVRPDAPEVGGQRGSQSRAPHVETHGADVLE